jgi:hypothetical protein
VLALWPLVDAAVQPEFWRVPRDIVEGAVAVFLVVALVLHRWWAQALQSLFYGAIVVAAVFHGPYTIFTANPVGCLVLLHTPQMNRYAPKPDGPIGWGPLTWLWLETAGRIPRRNHGR